MHDDLAAAAGILHLQTRRGQQRRRVAAAPRCASVRWSRGGAADGCCVHARCCLVLHEVIRVLLHKRARDARLRARLRSCLRRQLQRQCIADWLSSSTTSTVSNVALSGRTAALRASCCAFQSVSALKYAACAMASLCNAGGAGGSCVLPPAGGAVAAVRTSPTPARARSGALISCAVAPPAERKHRWSHTSISRPPRRNDERRRRRGSCHRLRQHSCGRLERGEGLRQPLRRHDVS